MCHLCLRFDKDLQYKETVYPKLKIMSLLTHPHAIQDVTSKYDLKNTWHHYMLSYGI